MENKHRVSPAECRSSETSVSYLERSQCTAISNRTWCTGEGEIDKNESILLKSEVERVSATLSRNGYRASTRTSTRASICPSDRRTSLSAVVF